MAKTNKGKTISIRLSESMLEALDARAVLDEKDRTQVIRDAIAQHLDLPEESVEDKLQVLEKKQNSLNKIIDRLSSQLKSQSKRTDSIEIRVEELRKIMAVFMEKSR
ncbi:MAG: ribbon-helix-helix protein, CopG family [Xenococcaceae cyanobacterium MO_167.B27]|nr:ribbon-helix-helix protein, CopG family [Xenococcaceae cyanobacterium MO_167.B27]